MSGFTPRQIAGPLRRVGGLTCAAASALALALAASAVADAGDPLYEWTDRRGVVRYTPYPDRIPGGLRDSAVLVEPGTIAPAGRAAPELPPSSAETAPLLGSGGAAGEPAPEADPFNAPGRASRVEAKQIAPAGPQGGSGSPELAPRIRQLEEAIARDEERLKELISLAPADGSDPLLHSAELREIARRLPELQADLQALRARRDRP